MDFEYSAETKGDEYTWRPSRSRNWRETADAGHTGHDPPIVSPALALVREHPGTDTVSARRRIGDLAIAHCRYPF